MQDLYSESVWVFNGANSIPSAVSTSRESAEVWISENKLSGMLTRYPLDEPLYDWAGRHEFFKAKRDDQKTSDFKARFTSAYLEHYHYEDGLLTA